MTSNEPSESKRSVYDTCDPQYLRELREAAGMDVFVLARTACLSVAQVRQLESDDSDGLFYSDAIKRQAYKRLLMILGAEPPTVEVPQELKDAVKVADAHLDTLDQIVAMSHQPSMNRSTMDVLTVGLAKFREHKQVMGALLLLLVSVALFVTHGPQGSSDAALLTVPVQQPETSVVANAAPVAPPVAAPVASMPAVVSVASSAAPVVVASAVAAPAPVASVAMVNKTSDCAYSSDVMPQLAPYVAQKEGRYVYLVSSTNAEICVIDGNKQATILQMKAGENRSVYGASPWQVSSAQLSKIQIYFQGGRVSLPDAANRVKLVEVPVSR